MYNKNYYEKFPITSKFYSDRKEMYKKYCENGRHEGTDFGSDNLTYLTIKNLLNGVVIFAGVNGGYGKSVRLYHNTKFVNKKDLKLYSQYCHLEDISEKLTKGFCRYGTYLGKMGNTGNSFGVHLHLMFFEENVKDGLITPLLDDITEQLNIISLKNVALWQFKRLFYNPEIIQKYFLKIQGENK
jgi:murein DD-endopeptidase MepM/ murein hydrolase activator NlpD